MTNSESGNYVTIPEFLDKAILFEARSAALYKRMAKGAPEGSCEQLLTMLAREEHRHMQVLQEEKERPHADEYFQFAPELSLSMPEPPDEGADLSELLDFAIERERQSARIYEQAAAVAKREFRQLLEGLATFEHEHEERLLSLRDNY